MKYPKILTLLLAILVAYILFQADIFDAIALKLNQHGYVSLFLGGVLFAFGFTSPFAVGLFISISDMVNPALGALVAGFGSLLADLLIFKFVRFSFIDEFEQLKLHWFFQKIKDRFDRHFSYTAKKYVLWTFAGILIASPLPDEFGVTLLSGMTNMNSRSFAVVSFLLNTAGIFLILEFAVILT